MKNRIIFEPIKAINPLNVSKISGYITNCQKCNDWVLVRHKIPADCIFCLARTLNLESRDMRRMYRRGQWKRLRKLTFGLKGKICVYCAQPATHVDHQTPISRGGTNSLLNLEPVCGRCNMEKFKKTHQEYVEFLKKKMLAKRV